MPTQPRESRSLAGSVESDDDKQVNEKSKVSFWRKLGPGLITGAADDDPSGIATYSQVGAQFGFHMLWVMLFTYPLMCGIQEISGKIGRVTGRGIAGNLRKHYHPAFMYVLVLATLIANVINIGADISAMGASVSMLVGFKSSVIPAAILAGISIVLQVFLPYDKYSRVLKWLCLALFAYIVTAFAVHVPWGRALHDTIIPYMSLKVDFVVSIVAVLGTTISPYLFFWQANEEVETQKAVPEEKPLKYAPHQAEQQLYRIRVDTLTGMAVSNIVAFFIILVAAVTLNATGHTDINTATPASALKPLAGKLAYVLFAVGIIGTGMLAVPVLAASAAYAVGEIFRWPVGLAKDPMRAKRFYATLAGATVLGLAMCVVHISPIKALFWSAVINGVVAGPIMIMMMIMGSSSKIMGEFTLTKRQITLGWLATLVMIVCAVIMFATWGKS